MRHRQRCVSRLYMIARLIVVGAVIVRELARTLGIAMTRRGRSGNRAMRWPDALARLLTELGPCFVKAGQLLGTRKDLLPERWIVGLRGLSDNVPPPPATEIAAALAAAYASGHWPFAELDTEPVACGSIATVHRAVLLDSCAVAVKIRRPGIEPTMLADVRLIIAVARLIGHLPGLRRVPTGEIAGQLGAAVLGQLDFTAEGNALAVLHANLADRPGLVVPAPCLEYCRDDILVMDYVSDLRQFEPAGLSDVARKAVVARTLEAVYRMLFIDGLVHCDLHPGNLYLTSQAHVIMLDAGFVVSLPDGVRRLFAEFFFNMALGRGRRCADLVIESAADVPADCDLEGFRARIADLVADATGALARDFSLAKFAPKLFAIQRSFGLYAAPEFIFPLLTLLVIEGMVNEFDPDVDFQAEAIPVLFLALADGPE